MFPLHGVGERLRRDLLLGVDEKGRMSGAGATSRVRATAGVTTAWGRALHAELLKVVTLPSNFRYRWRSAGGAVWAGWISYWRYKEYLRNRLLYAYEHWKKMHKIG